MEIAGAVDKWERIRKALSDDGWTVDVRLMWVAEARRRHDFEQGVGSTRDDAFEELQHLTRLDEIAGVP
jgi:hypothetical protein